MAKAGSSPTEYTLLYWFRVSACIFAMFLCASSGLAQESGVFSEPPAVRSISLGEMFTFFFLMLGPLKILGPFVHLTQKSEAAFARRLAIRGFLYSCLALVFSAFLGENSLRKYHISLGVLGIAAGIILFLVALKTVMEEFEPTAVTSVREYEPSMRLALTPLAFPTIVTPYGVAAVIICMTLTPDFLTKGEIFGALFVLMLLNLLAMLFAKPILRYAAMPMQLIGTVLGVIQVALGLQIIVAGLRSLGVVARH